MKKITLPLVLLILLSCNTKPEISNSENSLISQPVLIEDDDWSFEGTENLIFVPENRNDPNSREIAIHFFRFPAKEKSELPPVIFLGAGPGEPYSIDVFYKGRRAEAWRFELNFVNQKRDVILINQRGNPESPGLTISNFKYKWNNGGSLDKPFDLALMNKNRKEAYVAHIAKFESKGIDPKGYDIIHFIDDIEAIRKRLNYQKIALIGNSFASQWALGYIQRYPKNVDRALFSGIEPLDNNYDDPDGRWKVLEKIDAYAQTDPNIAQDLPEGGLLNAFKTIITKLEEQPEKVYLKDVESGKQEVMVVGADDLRYSLMNRFSGSYIGDVESWPKYITEMFHGDFRLLAMLSKGRIYNSSSIMTNPLFNNSIGISREREQIINSRASKKWLGDINAHYTSTRDVCPAPKVDNRFREHVKHDIPILLIQGDMDMKTPYRNAESLMNYLENGHLISVKRGFHNAKRALIFQDSLLINKVYGFMNIDFDKSDFSSFKKTLPSTYELPKFNFWPIKGESLFEKYND
jgi:pimeloyl-ACP methyl ester carboxylesterase